MIAPTTQIGRKVWLKDGTPAVYWGLTSNGVAKVTIGKRRRKYVTPAQVFVSKSHTQTKTPRHPIPTDEEWRLSQFNNLPIEIVLSITRNME